VKTQSVGVSSLSDKPSLDMTWGYDHVIVGVVISGLELNHFWARNAPTTSTCPLGETTVQIVARLRFLNLLATFVPAMTQDRRSHDLDDNVQINASNLCPSYLRTRSTLLESMVEVLFAIPDSGSLKSQTQLPSILQLSGIGDLWTPVP
jgi:hypothetical protein